MLNSQQITIVGCGLLGGSFALALRRAGFAGRITACGGSRSVKVAVEREIVDALETSFDEGAMCDADLIFLAAPIGGIIDFLKTRASQIKPGAIVTDAGSTKVEICRVAQTALPSSVAFIGGHPMAGSEYTGVEFARADLFDGATWALMREELKEDAVDEVRLQQLHDLIESLGARPLLTTPAQHDAAVALISHLPQLVASSLADLLNDESELARRLAASGWRDMTRLAGSAWSVWRDICLTNQPNISTVLDALIAELQQLKDALDTRDFNRVRELFEAANQSVETQRALHYQPFKKL
ncbi:MAG TPA: prephenate dehydrogenase/arogenate dehydrogenase family protein [Blastocatellia bacterium]|nr:prephenate dehydrogenase/arogenate dehydrogenase family protein [Blastocatellia bacterium]